MKVKGWVLGKQYEMNHNLKKILFALVVNNYDNVNSFSQVL